MKKALLSCGLIGLFSLGHARAQTTPVFLLKCDKMDVLYVGVDNPVSLYLPVPSDEPLDVSISDGTIEPANGNHYIVRVPKPGDVTITVRSSGRLIGQFMLRAKRVPDPAPTLSGASLRKNTALSAADFLNIRGLGMFLENFDFDARCSAVQFTLTRIDSAGVRSSVSNLGARFEEPARKLVAQAVAGDIYLFSDITVNCAREDSNRSLSNYAILVN